MCFGSNILTDYWILLGIWCEQVIFSEKLYRYIAFVCHFYGPLQRSYMVGILYVHPYKGAIVALIVWLLDLQLPMQLVPITTDVVSLNLNQGEVYNSMW